MGYLGSERTTRRAVAEAKRRWRQNHGRQTRPWVAEPGLWMQWDYGDGPRVGARETERTIDHAGLIAMSSEARHPCSSADGRGGLRS
jgi:hypothetical protein